jgi:ABC-2 type transport system permease protein
MIEMVRAELFKLRKRRMTWVLLIVLVAFFCLMFFATYGVISSPPARMSEEVVNLVRTSLQFPDAFDRIFAHAATIGTLLLIILVASSIGNEYGWGTVRQVLTRRGIRYHFVIAKLGSFVIMALIGLLISIIVGFILALITSNLLGSINWDFMTASYVGGLFQKFGWTTFSLMPYILMAAFFAFLGRSALVGIGGGLGFYFIEAIAVGIFNQSGGWLAEIPDYLIGPNVDALVPSIQMARGIFASSGTLTSTLHASVTLAIYCVVFLVISLYMFKKRDIAA